MRINSPDVREGARRIISHNLGLRIGEDLVILVDESTDQVGRAIVEGARHHGIRATLIIVPQIDQPKYSGNHNFPLPMARAIDSAQAVISALGDWPAGTGFRRHILDVSRNIKTKVALMPGATLDMIAELAHLDYERLLSHCDQLHLPFLLGEEVVITTSDKDNHSYKLEMQLGSWKQPPTISSGIVHSQSFDNIPSGEVYIAPIKGTANGEIIINGSITDYVFHERDEIKLTFRNGALVEFAPDEHPAAVFLKNAIANAFAQGDREANYLGELGIGVSPGIIRLTGNTLKDEKAQGTAHIAIGLNEPFGGNVEARHIHEDLIFCKPTILFDGKTIIEKGRICPSDTDWYLNFDKVMPNSSYSRTHVSVQTSGEDGEIKPEGILYRIYFDGTDARTRVKVGDSETASMAAKVYARLQDVEKISLEDLARALELPIGTLQSILYIMGKMFGLVEISS
jgi:leucyl aminopeptidase (aminopeptidase T)